MTGNPEVIVALQAALAAEAHLNLQYRKDWRNVVFAGANKLGGKLLDFGDDTHRWVKKITDRILLLDGEDSYSIPAITSQPTLTDTLDNELDLEMAIISAYEKLIATATGVDATTVHKFQHYQMYHEKHVAWLEKQLRLIASMGEADYIGEKL
jgi:bacterioferritin (cytochrome b1)